MVIDALEEDVLKSAMEIKNINSLLKVNLLFIVRKIAQREY